MTREYAELSLRAGLMAGAIDEVLGGHKFRTRMREHAWTLSAEKLAGWRAEAIGLGVLPEMLDLPPEIEAELGVWIEVGLQAQARFDDKLFS